MALRSRIPRGQFAILSRLAERQTAALSRQLLAALRSQARAVADGLRDGSSIEAATDSAIARWQPTINDIRRDAATGYGAQAYLTAGGLIGFRDYAERAIADTAARSHYGDRMARAIGIEFGASALVENHLRANVTRWLERSSKLETATTRQFYAGVWADSNKGRWDEDRQRWEGPTVGEIAQRLMDDGLAWSESRATLMARTTTNWGFNEGANLVYRDAGVERNEWLTTEDDATCEFCAAMDGRTAPVDGAYWRDGDTMEAKGGSLSFPFDVEHPPLHPHCRCALIPVIDEV